MRTQAKQTDKAAPSQPQTVYENYDPAKATSWGDRWGEDAISGLLGQMWVRWKESPLGVYYYYETSINGGEPRYEESTSGAIEPRFSYPDLQAGETFANAAQVPGDIPDFEAEDVRPNIFVVPFSWPQGYAGKFHIKGRILAFAKEYTDDSWRKARPLAVFPFEESFSIKDERDATDVTLMVKYQKKVVKPAPPEQKPAEQKPLTAAPPPAPAPAPAPAKPAPPGTPKPSATQQPQAGGVKIGRSKRRRSPSRTPPPRPTTITSYETVYEKFDPDKASPWDLWGEQEARGLNLQLWMNWRDVPPNKRYYVEAEVSGGTPDYRYQYKRRTLRALDSFPPHTVQAGPGTRFVLELPWPKQHAGRFQIKGKIYAVERTVMLGPTDEVKEKIAEFPFRKTFSTEYLPRQASGSLKVLGGKSYTASAYGKGLGRIKIQYLQAGRRVVRITADNKTVYALLNTSSANNTGYQGSLGFELPGTQGFDTATLTLRDFDATVKLQVPIEVTRRFTPPAFDDKCLEHTRSYRQPDKDLNTQALRYRQMAGCYAARATTDKAAYESRKQYWLKARDVLRKQAAQDGSPANLKFLYKALFEMAVGAGDLAEARLWFSQLESAAKQQGNADISYHYKQLAELIFRQTGDLNSARAAWQKYVEVTKKVRPKAPSSDLSFPWEVDPGFELH